MYTVRVTERDGRIVAVLDESDTMLMLVSAQGYTPGESIEVVVDEGPYAVVRRTGEYGDQRLIEYYVKRRPCEHISDTLDRLGIDETALL